MNPHVLFPMVGWLVRDLERAQLKIDHKASWGTGVWPDLFKMAPECKELLPGGLLRVVTAEKGFYNQGVL